MTDAAAGLTKDFEYLLNAMEEAAQADIPYEHGYADKRNAVLDYVAALLGLRQGADKPVAWRCVGTRLEFDTDWHYSTLEPIAGHKVEPLYTRPGDALAEKEKK